MKKKNKKGGGSINHLPWLEIISIVVTLISIVIGIAILFSANQQKVNNFHIYSPIIIVE